VIGIYHQVRKKMGLWLQGEVFLMFVVGTVSALGLWLLGVKYSLILGILAGLFEIVPVVGPIFSGALAFLVAVPQSLTLGIYVILLFLVIQQIEGHLLLPLVMNKAIGVNPVVVVVAVLAGAEIAGFVGIILAVPTAVILQEIVEDYERRKLKTRRLEIEE
jgi:predicted PurR-regulated permease PerM